MSFSTAYNALDELQKEFIDEFLNMLSHAYLPESNIIVENLRNEHFLEKNLSRKILFEILEFLSHRSKGSALEQYFQLKKELNSTFNSDYRCQGAKIKVAVPYVIGIVVPKTTFRNHLLRTYDREIFSLNVQEIEEFISNPKEYIQDEKYRKILISSAKCLIWCTWDESQISADPFYFVQKKNGIPQDRVEFCNRMGMGPKFHKEELLLFYFLTMAPDYEDLSIFRPTFCDASFSSLFRPTPINFTNYGLTIHFNNSEEGYTTERSELCRPQAVFENERINFSGYFNSILF